MQSCVERITNCKFDLSTFCQASLPVKLGGLGIRRTKDIGLPAFIASSMKSSSIVNLILQGSDRDPFSSLLSDAVSAWKSIDSRLTEPVAPASLHQKSWDLPVANLALKVLIENATVLSSRARLLAVSAPY